MKYLCSALLLTSAVLIGCSPETSNTASAKSTPRASAPTGQLSGKVVETIDTAGYTYVLLDTGEQKVWAAAPQCAVKVGDSVAIPDGMPMPNYESKSLNRTFDVVYFTGELLVNGAPSAGGAGSGDLPAGHPPIHAANPHGAITKPSVDLSNLEKAAGGVTVSEIFADPKKLGGKPVAVRGKVVKYNAMILGKNWLHVQDGTGSAGSNDLVVTTDAEVKVGDTVLVNGAISIDKDFGAGYKYSVIIEDAKVKVE